MDTTSHGPSSEATSHPPPRRWLGMELPRKQFPGFVGVTGAAAADVLLATPIRRVGRR